MNPAKSTETKVSIFFCGRKRVSCSSHDCGRRAVRTCCFPVKRNGVELQCERPVCDGCLVVVSGKEYCAAHARVAQRKANPG
jgi:hypothetical protein